jgi:hypothetical protein
MNTLNSMNSLTSQLAASSSQSYPNDPTAATNQAISRMELTKGWQNFMQQPWVKDLGERYPSAIELSHTCSAHRPEYKQQAEDLLYSAPIQDRQQLRNFFLGKLGLEELSCRRSGAGAGACDKRAAFMEIYRIASEACTPQQSQGIYL